MVIAAGAAAGLAAGPAAAATATWTVTPGGAFTNPIVHQSRLHDLFTSKNFACQSIKMTGTFGSGSGLVNPIGQIATVRGPSTSTIICDLPGIAFLITFTHAPMNIGAAHYDGATGVTQGVITGVHIKISTVPGHAPCTGVIDGTGPNADNGKIPFTYANTGGELDFAQVFINLTAYNVTGCGGHIHSGDQFIYQVAAFPRTSTGMANTITSP